MCTEIRIGKLIIHGYVKKYISFDREKIVIKVVLFLACSLWSAEDLMVINGQTFHINQDTLYQIADYTGTIKQHLCRARSSEFTEMYKNSLYFFRAYPKGPGGNFALSRYSDLPSNIDNQVIH